MGSDSFIVMVLLFKIQMPTGGRSDYKYRKSVVDCGINDSELVYNWRLNINEKEFLEFRRNIDPYNTFSIEEVFKYYVKSYELDLYIKFKEMFY